MSREGEYQYSENADFQAISLPYDKSRFSLYIFLPKKEKKLQNLLQKLSPNTWNQWLAQFNNKKGLLEVPRFKVAYEVELKKTLQALGMPSAFETGKANFSQMTSEPVGVDRVKHKTFIEVNEEGTEAAAITSIRIRATSATPLAEPFRMVVNRPFFYAIRDNQTKTILFMGTMVEPK